jgi:hypothetical protein
VLIFPKKDALNKNGNPVEPWMQVNVFLERKRRKIVDADHGIEEMPRSIVILDKVEDIIKPYGEQYNDIELDLSMPVAEWNELI